MTTKTVTIGKDGSLVITKSDDGDSQTPPPPPGTETGTPVVIHTGRHHNSFDGGAFFAGLFVGVILVLLFQSRRRKQAAHAELVARDRDREPSRTDSEYAALARRTANLERIVTDPAQRVGAEIDALR